MRKIKYKINEHYPLKSKVRNVKSLEDRAKKNPILAEEIAKIGEPITEENIPQVMTSYFKRLFSLEGEKNLSKLMIKDNIDYELLLDSRAVGGYLLKDLRDIAGELELTKSGTKSQLVDRIISYYEN